jgi:uncharacterized 2Fe-2S/4Fe-4S cluster protein (DUF4445 family)
MRVRFQPFGVTSEAQFGQTLLQAAIAAGVEIESVCGGRGTCRKCKVIATHGLAPLAALEHRGLSAHELELGYRLACQAVIEGDVDVVVPEESRISRVSILSEGVGEAVRLDPWVRRHHVRAPAATLETQVCDLDNLMQAWGPACDTVLEPTLRALRQLPDALRQGGGEVTVITVDGRLVRVTAGPPQGRLLGIAFDIGTTTVVGYLMDLETGEQLAVSAQLNPQTRHGDDVVSRIEFSTHEAGLQILQQEIVGCLNHLIVATTQQAGALPGEVLAVTVVGNTTMQHLLLGVSPAALAQAPYVPVVEDAVCLRGAELGLAMDPDGHVWLLPNIAGWVGADTVGVILATRLYEQDEVSLAIDIGTNGEMALGSRQRIITCSAAAGPAFEGAHLSCGMRAADGAIDRVQIDSDVLWHTIGEAAPRGVCGSGLVDVVAEMLRVGVITPAGMMQDGDALSANGAKALGERILRNGRQREFVLARAAEGAGGRAVTITQRDVRELQLAKGAIRAGVEILLKELGVRHEAVRHVFFAGAFGNYISPASALMIGLMPRFPNATVTPVGNAAGSGAKMALLSRAERERASEMVRWIEYLELSGRSDFQEIFAEAMIF